MTVPVSPVVITVPVVSGNVIVRSAVGSATVIVVSLALSVITLFILYPLIYKVYHQDADDKLTNEQIERVVVLSLKYCAKKLKIDIEWDIFKFKVKELSIDVLVAYRTTNSTIASKIDVRAEILKEILNEFGIFRVLNLFCLLLNRLEKLRELILNT